MFSIKFKIILSYTILFGILLTIFVVIIYQSVKQNDLSRLDANLNSYSNILQTEIEEELNEDYFLNPDEIKSIPSQGMYDVRVQVFDKRKGKIFSDSILTEDNSFDKEMNFIKVNIYKTIKINNKAYRSLLSPVEADEDTTLVLQTAASLENIENDLNRLLLIFWIVIPLALLITGLTAFFISKKAFNPVIQMAETANRISIDSLDKRLDLPNTRDEIYGLGETLNQMIERIDNSVKSQRQFIADASHEIKTPLTIIQTELELVEKKLVDLSLKENIQVALSEVERLNGLVQSLLTLVKLESFQNILNLKNIRLDELLVECFRTMKKTADENNIQLTVSLSDPVEIKGDEEKLKSIFINLIDNAVKYSGKNSVVSIEMRKSNNDSVEISVADNGQGMTTEEANNVFKRFYRSNETRSDISGSGLGLSITKKLVEMHNGKIKVQSSPGKGSKFTVILPINS